ncbi:hypothetical protein L1887_58894 [Cichorium endivia]|nr:hypothetical protein L1887_58894 [Cichorium endivia]
MLAALWLCGIVGFAMRTCSSSVRLSWRSSLTVRRDPFEVGHRASNHSDTLTELDFRGMIQVAAATSELCVCINSRGGLKATGHISSRLGSMWTSARDRLQDDVRPRKGDMNVTCAETQGAAESSENYVLRRRRKHKRRTVTVARTLDGQPDSAYASEQWFCQSQLPYPTLCDSKSMLRVHLPTCSSSCLTLTLQVHRAAAPEALLPLPISVVSTRARPSETVCKDDAIQLHCR